MADLVWFFFSSGGVVCSLLAAALWIWLRPGSRRGRQFLLAIALLYTALSSYAVSYATGRLLLTGLRPFEKSDVPAGRIAIVLLGSASFTSRDWDENTFSTLDRAAASRVVETVRVFNLTNAEWVVSSGGLVHLDAPEEPSGLTMADALVRLGVPDGRVLIETKSRNTHDEAVIVRAMLADLPVDHVVLVTSDIHMRRSLGAFRSEGIDAIPAIARHPQPYRSWGGWVIPSELGLAEAASVWHEVIGIGYYLVRGWYRQ